jgi:hypothetical protein
VGSVLLLLMLLASWPVRRALAVTGAFASVVALPAHPEANAEGQGANQPLPAGTKLYLRLETPVSTKASHLRDTVQARIIREVSGPDGVLIPLGARIHGRLEKLVPSSSPTDRARVLIRFEQVEIPGKQPAKVAGHLTEVENARESVLPDGTIEGVLASELPLTHLETALGKLEKEGGDLTKAKEKALGKSDTSIDFPVGTDLVWELDKPLALAGTASPAASRALSAGVAAAVGRLLADAPQRASGKKQQPGDPLNLVFIGDAEAIRRAFREAGWSEAEKTTGKSIWETVRAVAADQGYGAAPVSQLFLYGRPEDLAFEKMLNTFTKRHHLRLWRSLATTPDGREIWLGAATHDTGLDVRPGVVSHAIDPDLDAERDKVGADILVTGRVNAQQLVSRPEPLREGLTATGASWRTDGRLLATELKSP